MHILQDEQQGLLGSGPGQQIDNGEVKPGLGSGGRQRGRRPHRPPHQPGDVRHDGMQHGRFQVGGRCLQQEWAEQFSPEMVRPAVGLRLAAQNLGAVDQGNYPQLLQQPAFAHAAFPYHQPAAAVALHRLLPGSFQAGQFGRSANKRGSLQEAFTGGHRFRRKGEMNGRTQSRQRFRRRVVAGSWLFGQQPLHHGLHRWGKAQQREIRRLLQNSQRQVGFVVERVPARPQLICHQANRVQI